MCLPLSLSVFLYPLFLVPDTPNVGLPIYPTTFVLTVRDQYIYYVAVLIQHEWK